MAKRLYRSRKQKVISGVCGGIGEYIKIDPVLVRLGFVALAFMGDTGLGLVLYFAAMFIIPQEPAGSYTEEPVTPEVILRESSRSRQTLAIILIALGTGLILYRFGLPYFRFFTWQWPFADVSLWPLALIVLGVFMLFRNSEKHN